MSHLRVDFPYLLVCDLIVCVFFFQAEDGIRDIGVTGVQTCALPICTPEAERRGFVLQRIGGAPAHPQRYCQPVYQTYVDFPPIQQCERGRRIACRMASALREEARAVLSLPALAQATFHCRRKSLLEKGRFLHRHSENQRAKEAERPANRSVAKNKVLTTKKET